MSNVYDSFSWQQLEPAMNNAFSIRLVINDDAYFIS